MECFPLTTQPELRLFCHYLRENLDLELSDKKPGSLILTVHCRTLEILERLWNDYHSGHLDEVAKEFFLREEATKTKEERGEKSEVYVDTISLETSISKEDYLRCKKFLTEISGKLSSYSKMSARLIKRSMKGAGKVAFLISTASKACDFMP